MNFYVKFAHYWLIGFLGIVWLVHFLRLSLTFDHLRSHRYLHFQCLLVDRYFPHLMKADGEESEIVAVFGFDMDNSALMVEFDDALARNQILYHL